MNCSRVETVGTGRCADPHPRVVAPEFKLVAASNRSRRRIKMMSSHALFTQSRLPCAHNGRSDSTSEATSAHEDTRYTVETSHPGRSETWDAVESIGNPDPHAIARHTAHILFQGSPATTCARVKSGGSEARAARSRTIAGVLSFTT